MTKRKIALLSFSMAIIALLVGGSFAFYAASERTHNIVTSGGVKIRLFEDTDQVGADGRPLPFQNIANATPGETYSKIPKVRNVDDGAAWIRIKMTPTATLTDGNIVPADVFQTDINSQYWLTGNDGYYYYYRVLNQNETTEPLFTEAALASDLDNIYKGATFGLTLSAQAVQQKNNGADVFSAQGWPEE